MPTSGYFGEMAPAAHSRKKSEMVTALAEADTNEEFFPELMARISDGQFLSSIADDLHVNHSILRNWIRGNKERERIYQEAEKQGRFARVEKVMRKVHDIATTDVADPPSHMEALRAAEILLKHEQPAPGDAPPRSVANIAITFVDARDGKPVEKVIGPLP